MVNALEISRTGKRDMNRFNKEKGGAVMKLKPLEDRVLIKPSEIDEDRKGGIIIPDSAKEKPQQGVVMEIGPGKVENGKWINMKVRKGDIVLYGKYSGTGITIDEEEYLIIRAPDILAIVG